MKKLLIAYLLLFLNCCEESQINQHNLLYNENHNVRAIENVAKHKENAHTKVYAVNQRPFQTVWNTSNIDNLETIIKNKMCKIKKNESHLKPRNCPSIQTFLGSNLFDGIRKVCFSPEDVNLLTARQQFEMIIPKRMKPVLLDDNKVRAIMRFFCYGHWVLKHMKNCSGGRIIKKAYYDTVGGFLHSYFVPIVKSSFYAGRIRLGTVLKVIAHYEKCRILLNTHGSGWREPIEDPLKSIGKGLVMPLPTKSLEYYEDAKKSKFCSLLDLKTTPTEAETIDEDMLVPLPRIDIEDSDGFLGNIWLPYNRKRTFNLRSQNSRNVLVYFFKVISGCYREKNMPQHSYNRKFKQWIIENVQAHLADDIFYPGLGGVLNVYETLRRTFNQTKLKKGAIECGHKRSKRFEASVREILRKERRNTEKFLTLESKAKQIDTGDDCEKNWLELLNITSANKLNEKKEKVKGGKNKDKGKRKKKFKWKNPFSFKNPLKSSWFSLPTFSGLTTKWDLFKEIFKLLFIILLALFLFCLIYKLVLLCMAVGLDVGGSAAGSCLQILLRSIIEFLKAFLKVFLTICSGIFNLLFHCCKRSDDTSKSIKEPKPPPEITVKSEDEPKQDDLEPNSRSKGGCFGKKSSKKSAGKSGAHEHNNVTPIQHPAPARNTNIGKEVQKTEKINQQEKQVSFDEEVENANKTKRKTRSSKRKNATPDNKRLSGGHSNSDWSPWQTDTSARDSIQRDESGVTSWQTFYEL